MAVDFMSILKLDERELMQRRAFFEITDDDLTRVANLRDFAARHGDAIVDDLYQLILGHSDSRAFFADETMVRRVKNMQKQYFLGLFAGNCDLRYVQDRLRVGASHERIGLEPKWYLGAYGRYLRLLLDRLFADFPPAEAQANFRSLSKLVAFDIELKGLVAAGKGFREHLGRSGCGQAIDGLLPYSRQLTKLTEAPIVHQASSICANSKA